MGTWRHGMGVADGLTRRGLLTGAAAAGAASLLRPPAGLASALLAADTVFSRRLGTVSGESTPIRAPRRFALVGIEWSSPRGAGVELRAQAPDGRWSPWVIASALGHDGDGQPTDGSLFGEPVWTGPAIRVQLRTDRPIAGVRVHFVSANLGPGAGAAAALPHATPVLDAGPGQPPIIARRGWAGGAAQPRHLPEYGHIKLAFVHHTVNPNGYGPGAVPAMLRAIFDYHVHVRGWWDIGYNFIVDAYGRVWEGRAGGVDMAVVGAQAGAYNTESTGVAMLGDFMNVVPSPAAMQALEQLLAWKLSLHGVPATGRTTVIVDPKDAYYTRFRPGAHVSLPRIAGHRDGDLTDCPGNALYASLQSVRSKVSQLAGTPAQVTAHPAPALITAGSLLELTGKLALLGGQPLSGQPLELQRMGPNGPPATTFATLTTGSDGTWAQTVSFEQNTLVRALHREAPAAVADWVEISVAPAITVSVQSTSPLVLAGTVAPAQKQVTLELHRATAPRGKPVSRRRVRAAAGAFRGSLRVPGPGNYVVIARTAAGRLNAAGSSAPVPLTVA
ncbi:MAG: peptidoglycan recognition protein [Candidatus Woesearchaeota archaeon]